MVIRESAWLTVLGIAAGCRRRPTLGRLVKSILYGLTPNDPISLADATLVLLTIALLRTTRSSTPTSFLNINIFRNLHMICRTDGRFFIARFAHYYPRCCIMFPAKIPTFC